jgi:hypothetical protein
MLALSAGAGAEDGRYQAFQLSGAESGKSGARALILDSRDGHVWVWSENELVAAPDGARRYSTGFIYQGKLRPGSRPGEMIDQQSK